MCGRYSLTSPVEAMRALFGFDELPNLQPRYNIAPTQDVPVIRNRENSGRELAMLRWGLVPAWAKEVTGSAPLINARGETVAEKPSFRDAFAKRRCLIPADGFYEWRKTEKGVKQPFRIALPDDTPFAFAGIWERWRSAQGELLESCALITTAASEQIVDIHHRMPVILKPETYEIWLAGAASDLIAAYNGELRAYPIDTAVNKVANDDARIWDEITLAPQAEQLDLL
jgi:putative SOS response-associated peptidase YedK